MNSSRLSQRLFAIRRHYSNQAHVWDIGCDHGDLGLSFVDEKSVEHIHLVDPSPSVIRNLEIRIKTSASYITKVPLITIHQSHGQEINKVSKKSCIFIAGMGGRKIGEIIDHLYPYLTSEDRIIVSPHRAVLDLREKLRLMDIELLNEELIKEGRNFYQILSLSKYTSGHKVSLYGENIWQGEFSLEYKNEQLRHFGHHQDEASKAYLEYLRSL